MTNDLLAHRAESRDLPDMPTVTSTIFSIGDVVRHRMFDFRGVIFDIDPVFANSDEWYDAIPEGIRPRKDQPFYHLLAEGSDESYVAYVSQQNLLGDNSGDPVDHPGIGSLFDSATPGSYSLKRELRH